MRMIIDAHGQYFPDQETFAELARQVNHDMRSPLTAICTYAECLAWLTALDLTTREKYARAIIAEARRLSRMGGYFASLASPPAATELQELQLGEILDEALEELRDLAELQELTLTREPYDEPLPLIWPRQVLHQIILGTVETLMEWAGQKAVLSLGLRLEGEHIVLQLSAGGDQRPNLDTNRFGYRSARTLLHAHGGKVAVAVGESAAVSLHIPYIGRMRLATADDLLERSA